MITPWPWPRPGHLALVLAVLCGCVAPPPLPATDGPVPDGPTAGGRSDGGAAPLFAAFTVTGCAELVHEEGGPRCSGPAPLQVRLVPIHAGGEQLRWQVTAEAPADGGATSLLDETRSRERAPELVLGTPGHYAVSLALGGPGGTASAWGAIVVRPAALGAPCSDDANCEPGLHCLCGRGGGACPGGLGAGLCTRSCEAAACPAGSECLDLSRSAPPGDGGMGPGEPWRQPLCVPACRWDADCRPDFLCRTLPLRGAKARFSRVCFLGQPATVGEACAAPGGDPDPSACATALCEPLGARALCSWACDVAQRDCPEEAACAAWNGGPGAPAGPRCLPRCDVMRPCQDPLLQCQAAGGAGALGFRLPGEPAGATVCAPRRCSGPADCKVGRCTSLGGASFCVR